MRCNIIMITITFFLIFYDSSAQAFTSEEGPYQAIITNTSICSAGQSWFRSSIAAYTKKGQSLIKGNFNYTRDAKDMKFRVTIHYLEAKKVKVFDMKNLNCHNNIIELILTTIHMPFNRQNCKIKAGYYEFCYLNLDAIMHSVVQSLWYGSVQLRVNVDVRTGPMFCLDIYYRAVKIEKAA